MTNDLDARPLPAPLPYSSQAGRGEIPAAPPSPMLDRDHYDPDAPLMREDDLSFWIAVGFIVYFIVIMTIASLMGGL